MDIVNDNSEFGLLIQQVVRKEIPAYIEGDDVWLMGESSIKNRRKFIRKIAADLPGRNDPCLCGSGKKFKKCHGGIV
jgi:uncharacterized protein YecA (UPF0149 family)